MLKTVCHIPILAVLGCVLALSGCSRGEAQPAPERADGVAVPSAGAGSVECAGVLRAARTLVVRLGPGETVAALHAHAGDRVSAGENLVTLSNPALQTEWLAARDRWMQSERDAAQVDVLSRKKAAAEQRVAALTRQVQEAEGLRGQVDGYDPRVHARDVIEARDRARDELDDLSRDLDARLRWRDSDAQVRAGREQYVSQLEQRVSNLVVRAPWTGVVVRGGDATAPDGVVLELHDRSRFAVDGALWQNQLARVSAGCRAIVTPDFMPGHSWTGTVASIGLAALPGHESGFPCFPVRITLDDGVDLGQVRDGMTVLVRIDVTREPASAP